MKKTILQILFLIILVSCQPEEDNDYDEQCKSVTGGTKESCWALDLSPGNQCCFSNYTDGGDFQCMHLNDVDYDVYSHGRTFYYRRETEGFECYNGRDPSDEDDFCEGSNKELYNYVYQCKKGTVYDKNEIYTEEEKKILGDNEHCYNFAKLSIFSNISITKNDCYKGKLTESAKKSGLTCAFFQYVFTFKDKTINHDTCYLFNPDFLKDEENFKEYSESLGRDFIVKKHGEFESFTLSLSDSSGNSVSYDSKSDKLSYQTKSSNSKSSGNIQNINFIQFLFLLFLISL